MTNSTYYKSITMQEFFNIPIFKRGNQKIGKNTIIFSIDSAHNCISRKLNLCRIKKKCYAYRDELQYKQSLVYRSNQAKYWNTVSVHQFIKDIDNIIKRTKHKIKYLRFNESGDIRNITDIQKMEFIAKWLKSEHGITTYTYTARYDLLPYLKKCKHLVVNGSSFMVHNSFNPLPETKVKQYKTRCKLNCSSCSLCKTKLHLNIYAPIH